MCYQITALPKIVCFSIKTWSIALASLRTLLGSLRVVQNKLLPALKNKDASTLLIVDFSFSVSKKCGPTWARTKDHLIMSQVL